MPRLRKELFLMSIGVIAANVASGQSYPDKPIRIAVTQPGSGSDFTARQVAQISDALGQPVIVEYRGSGVLTAESVSKAPPDGYTLLVGGSSLWLQPLIIKTPYEMSDLSPISLLTREVSVFVVPASLPVTSIKDLIALAKAKPGELNYASGSAGGQEQLNTELLKSMTGINLVNVLYKGSAPAIVAMLSGEVHLLFTDPGNVAAHVQSGRLRALAVTSAEPSPLAPGLPTVASTVPGYEAIGRTGIWAPAKTPAAIINRLNQEIVRHMSRQEVKEAFFKRGAEVVALSPEQSANTIKSEITKMNKVIKDAGIKVDR